MTKNEFLSELRSRLDFMSEGEVQVTLDFYEENIDACIARGISERDAVAAAGSAQEIAERLKREREAAAPADDTASVGGALKHSGTKKRSLFGAIAGIAVAGLAVTAASLSSALSEDGYTTRSVDISECFDLVEINTSSSAVSLLPSEDGSCRAEYVGRAGTRFSAEVRDNVLYINVDETPSFDINALFAANAELLSVYLPAREYEILHAATTSGAISAVSLDAGELTLNATSGKVSLSGGKYAALSLSSSSGALGVKNVEVTGAATVESTSGSVRLSALKCAELSAESTSGSIHLADVTASGHVSLKTISGSIKLERADAQALSLNSSSGSIEGTLLSPKRFTARSSSGSISIPVSGNGGECSVFTTSGSIRLSLA